MGITTESSLAVKLAEGTGAAGQYLSARQGVARLYPVGFSFTQGAAAGDIASLQRLCKLPGGQIKVIGIYFAGSVFGAARTISVGYEAHTTIAGATVAASVNAFTSAVDVSGATAAYTALNVDLDSPSGIVVTAKVAGGTIPAAATINGYFLVSA